MKSTILEVDDDAGRMIFKVMPNPTQVFIKNSGFLNGNDVLKINRNGDIRNKK